MSDEESAALVRDSWDVLETPRTPQSDISFTEELKQENQSSTTTSGQQNENSVAEEKTHKYAKSSKVKSAKHNHYKQTKKRITFKEITLDSEDAERAPEMPEQIVPNSSEGSRLSQSTTVPNDLNRSRGAARRKYGRRKIQTHEDMLNEHYEELKILLNDSKNLTRQQLRQEHIEQSQQIMQSYKLLGRGSSPNNILISRSLPVALRSRSPSSRSSSQCSSYSPKGSTSSSSSRSHRSLSPQSARSSYRSSSPELTRDSYRPSSPQSPRRRYRSISSASRSSSHRSLSPSTAKNDRKQVTFQVDEDARNISDLLERRAAKQKPRTTHMYLNDPQEHPSSHHRLKKDRSSAEEAAEEEQKTKVQDHNDHGLKKVTNPEVRKWVREKEKDVRKKKREEKLKEKKKQEEKEQLKIKAEERQKEAKASMKRWIANKKKEQRMLRRNKLKANKLEVEEAPSEPMKQKSSVENIPKLQQRRRKVHRPKSAAPTSEAKCDDKENLLKPTPPKTTRPSSAQPGFSGIRPLPLHSVVASSPKIQMKFKELERLKNIKNRQSYDDWMKVKKEEKMMALKMLRKQRQQLEKEIDESTEQIIKEAAERRKERMKFQTRTEFKRRTSPKQGSAKFNNADPLDHQEDNIANKHTPKRATSSPQPARNRLHVEETVCTDETNPFKTTKLKRPGSKLENQGINGPEFSSFIWELVNEQERDEVSGKRPEPQGSDAPSNMKENASEPKATKEAGPNQSSSPIKEQKNLQEQQHPEGIFSMTSIE